ncbi:MAG: HD domain-containing protein [Thermodesulfobacteriota bacterium]
MCTIFTEDDRQSQIQRIRTLILEKRRQGASDPSRLNLHTFYDALLTEMADHFLQPWKAGFALVAMGGYGRAEMWPYSDLDMIFLLPDDAPPAMFDAISSVLHLLWDSKVEASYSVRTVKECRQEAEKDLAVLTSLQDIRLVWGSEETFRRLVDEREALVDAIDPLDLYLMIEDGIRVSCDQFRTIYLLEPHLKEGPGSLRYVQLVTWLARMLFGAENLDDLTMIGVCDDFSVQEAKRAIAFMSNLRARLHYLAGRADDRLSFDAQTKLAAEIGFADTPEQHSVVRFMRDYYRHAATIDFFGRRVLARARLFLRPEVSPEIKRLKINDTFYIGAGGLNLYEPDTLYRHPSGLLVGFLVISQTNCELDIRLIDLIRSCLDLVDDAFLNDPQNNWVFLKIFGTRGTVGKTSRAMMKTGFLERFIREFARIRFLPTYDAYHHYTVDQHTIMVLENLDAFVRPGVNEREALVNTVCVRLENPLVLYLAALFHDMGKGSGAGHEVRGEILARPVLERLGLPAKDVEDVCFLIRNHLAIPHLAFKKDMHDHELIGRFAETVATKRRLDMLFVLTHADLQAVRPADVSPWRRMLLEEVYYRTVDAMESQSAGGEDLEEWTQQIRSLIPGLVPARYRDSHLARFIEGTPSRYLLDFYPGIIAEHYVFIREHLEQNGLQCLQAGDVIVRRTDHEAPGYSAVTLIARDRPGLFFRFSGAFSANGINILSAWTHSIGRVGAATSDRVGLARSGDGSRRMSAAGDPCGIGAARLPDQTAQEGGSSGPEQCVDLSAMGEDLAVSTFHVNDVLGGVPDDPDRWDRFLATVTKVIAGELDIDEVMTKRRKGVGFSPRKFVRNIPLRVEIDNVASDRATIVEIYAQDRPGLLYDIGRCICALGLYITVTKITTERDQAADIFYVVDLDGHKIVDFAQLDRIRAVLLDHLTKMEDYILGKEREAPALALGA